MYHTSFLHSHPCHRHHYHHLHHLSYLICYNILSTLFPAYICTQIHNIICLNKCHFTILLLFFFVNFYKCKIQIQRKLQMHQDNEIEQMANFCLGSFSSLDLILYSYVAARCMPFIRCINIIIIIFFMMSFIVINMATQEMPLKCKLFFATKAQKLLFEEMLRKYLLKINCCKYDKSKFFVKSLLKFVIIFSINIS